MSRVAKPLFARVLVKRRLIKQVGRILVPEEAQQRHAGTLVEVLAVGPNADPSIKVGQEVIIAQYAGAWVNLTGKVGAGQADDELFIVQDEDVLAVVEETKS